MFQARRWWVLATVSAGLLLISLDVTILYTALPTLTADLDADASSKLWIINAYPLVMAGLLLGAGTLGDRVGHKRMFLIGLVLFGMASTAAAFAPSAAVLIGARAFLAVGAAAMMPATLALVRLTFDDERERGIAIGIWGTVAVVGAALGPVAGGLLLNHFWWGSIFLINIPMAAIALTAIVLLMPETRDPAPRRLDLPGALLSTAGLVTLVYGIIEAPDRGWGDPLVLGLLALAAVLLFAFGTWELRTEQPMIDLRWFARRQFLWASLAGMLVSFTLLGMLFVLPQYLQDVAGHSAFGTGLRLLPMIGGLVVGAPLGERLAAGGYRIPVGVGLLLSGAGLAVGATTDTGTSYGFVVVWLTAVGMGIGMALSPAMDAVLDDLPSERSGAGTAITMTLRQVGGALGVALLGSLLAQGYADRVDTDGLPAPAADAANDSVAGGLAVAARLDLPELAASAQDAYMNGMTLVLIATGAVAILSAVLTTALLPGRPAVTAAAGSGAPDPAGGAPAGKTA